MAALMGHSKGVQFIPGSGGQSVPMAAAGSQPSPTTNVPAVIDGTPVRVVVIALASAVGLMALHTAGFRFNVAVSG